MMYTENTAVIYIMLYRLDDEVINDMFPDASNRTQYELMCFEFRLKELSQSISEAFEHVMRAIRGCMEAFTEAAISIHSSLIKTIEELSDSWYYPEIAYWECKEYPKQCHTRAYTFVMDKRKEVYRNVRDHRY